MLKAELESKIRSIKARLDEIRQYKRVIAEEGLTPDQEDKRVESELIVRLLRLERELAEKEGLPVKPRSGFKGNKVNNGKSAPGTKRPKQFGKADRPRETSAEPRKVDAKKSPGKPAGKKPNDKKPTGKKPGANKPGAKKSGGKKKPDAKPFKKKRIRNAAKNNRRKAERQRS